MGKVLERIRIRCIVRFFVAGRNDRLTESDYLVNIAAMRTKHTSPPRSARSALLLDAAAELFARWGFDKTSVEDIAREAGVSKGAVYLEFRSKDELFRVVVYRELERYRLEWLRQFEEDSAGWSFARMFQYSMAAMNANPIVKALMTRDQRVFGNFLQREPELLRTSLSARAELFDQLQQAGAVRDDMPPKELAYLLSIIVYGMIVGAEVIPEEHRVSFDRAIGALGLLLDRGLAPEAGSAKEVARPVLAAMAKKMKISLQEGAADAGHSGAK